MSNNDNGPIFSSTAQQNDELGTFYLLLDELRHAMTRAGLLPYAHQAMKLELGTHV